MEKLLHYNRCLFLRCASCLKVHKSSFRAFHLAYPACKQTHYEILGLSKDATTQEIKEAFVRLSKEVHPDLNPDDPENHKKFVLLNEAYNVLSKLSSRREYDEMLEHGTGFSSTGTYYHGPGTNYEDFSDSYYNPAGERVDRMEYYNVRGFDRRTNGHVGIIAVGAIMMGTLSFVIALMYSFKKRRDYDDLLHRQNKVLVEEQRKNARKFTTAEQLESFILKHQKMVSGITESSETLASDSKRS